MANSDIIVRQWLWALGLLYVTYWQFKALELIANPVIDYCNMIGCLFVLLPLILVISASIVYHCAYKKHGTLLLGLQLILMPVMFAGNLAKALEGGISKEHILFYVIFFFPSTTCYWINSFWLYRLNKSMKKTIGCTDISSRCEK